ncbi:MAG: hypothetical protein WBD40_18070 [Tepidisphaeraceae bacterium]
MEEKNIDRHVMTDWVVEALSSIGGRGTILDVCRQVWMLHGPEIERSGDMFYKWQYEIRWAADLLRKEARLRSEKGQWKLPHTSEDRMVT